MNHSRAAVYFLLLSLLAIPCARAQNATSRPCIWACPLTLAGVTNFYQVTTNLYRGAQPTAEGMARLKELGVKYVVSLRFLRSDGRQLHGTGLKSLNLGMVPWHPKTEDVLRFLKVATDTNNLPVFVHCQYGADRTGFMCALYRVVVCGWTKEAAIAEMKNGGFHFGPSHTRLISFIENADVAAYQRQLGLFPPPIVGRDVRSASPSVQRPKTVVGPWNLASGQ